MTDVSAINNIDNVVGICVVKNINNVNVDSSNCNFSTCISNNANDIYSADRLHTSSFNFNHVIAHYDVLAINMIYHFVRQKVLLLNNLIYILMLIR
jgi:hypothetical protein